ncbi:MAG: UDP-N-acetylmuramate:L-alanyl-gamma-D-glutamyl-meso-diaminopimelate ligase [Gammaproteobacteria bacterium]|jgi:UDP-N-acetylmuramate: L-alanyl-gamma-D-glutamyl-meso-diaminopimelate ligase|nr:UDP-N-acetylmuramate:L-alanyl-gamma-D-glutamyl-meso-diaminopimelate ligase [Gammaproteobacteria bacterium]
MHIHILGICGTFMGGIAALARAAGHTVTGSDRGVYPPMSTQLEALGIELIDGFEPGQLDGRPDLVVVGNVMTRGMPIIERLLNSGMPYTSGPAWLARHVLRDRHVIAIAGTHGKTTTASMTAWLLEHAGLQPGFLIGGVPANFATTARLGTGEFFVIEADEYDTAFFDKRAKFLHYGPRTLVINNLEFDHADIYADMSAILWQFHQLLRMMPGSARLIVNAAEPAIDELLEMGCWSEVERYSSAPGAANAWSLQVQQGGFRLESPDARLSGEARLQLPGAHNAENAVAATLAARHVGVDMATALAGLAAFRGVQRRMEHLGDFAGVSLYDDFAHHPTAIRRTLEAARGAFSGRILAVLEPRSNSMKLGAHRAELPAALGSADRAWVFAPPDLPWSLETELAPVAGCSVMHDIPELVAAVVAEVRPGDAVIIMSNGGFAGMRERLPAAVAGRFRPD